MTKLQLLKRIFYNYKTKNLPKVCRLLNQRKPSTTSE